VGQARGCARLTYDAWAIYDGATFFSEATMAKTSKITQAAITIGTAIGTAERTARAAQQAAQKQQKEFQKQIRSLARELKKAKKALRDAVAKSRRAIP